MTATARNVLEQALALPEEDRRHVAEALLDSMAGESSADLEEETEAAWRDEVMRRIGQVRRGEVQPEPWSKVKQRIRQILDR